MNRRLRALRDRLRPFALALCGAGAALLFAFLAYANQDDVGTVSVTAFLSGCLTVAALVLATSAVDKEAAHGER